MHDFRSCGFQYLNYSERSIRCCLDVSQCFYCANFFFLFLPFYASLHHIAFSNSVIHLCLASPNSSSSVMPVSRNRVSPELAYPGITLFLSTSIPHLLKSQPMDKKLQA